MGSLSLFKERKKHVGKKLVSELIEMNVRPFVLWTMVNCIRVSILDGWQQNLASAVKDLPCFHTCHLNDLIKIFYRTWISVLAEDSLIKLSMGGSKGII